MAKNQRFTVAPYSTKSKSRGECIINVKKKLSFLTTVVLQTFAVSFASNMFYNR